MVIIFSKQSTISIFTKYCKKEKAICRWAKVEKLSNLEYVKEYYGYSNEKAKACSQHID